MPDSQRPRIKAHLFKNGRSQAVRLPKSLRFDAEEVYIWKEGDRVILEAVPRQNWPPGYWAMVDDLAVDLQIEVDPLIPGLLDLDL